MQVDVYVCSGIDGKGLLVLEKVQAGANTNVEKETRVSNMETSKRKAAYRLRGWKQDTLCPCAVDTMWWRRLYKETGRDLKTFIALQIRGTESCNVYTAICFPGSFGISPVLQEGCEDLFDSFPPLARLHHESHIDLFFLMEQSIFTIWGCNWKVLEILQTWMSSKYVSVSPVHYSHKLATLTKIS